MNGNSVPEDAAAGLAIGATLAVLLSLAALHILIVHCVWVMTVAWQAIKISRR